MEREDVKSYLQLKVIWKDNEMFEIEVTATNGCFSGKSEVYDTSESLTTFANSLLGYPDPKENKILTHEAGEKDGYAYFSMRFYCIDNAGHVGVEVVLEKELLSLRKDKLKLEIKVEPHAIDNFQKQILTLAKNVDGTATLYGI